MRARWLALCLLAACGGEDERNPAPQVRAPAKAEFDRWPEATTIAVRLPPPARVAAEPEGVRALLGALGRGGTGPGAFLFGADAPEGMVADAPAWAALTSSGGWLRALPAADMAALRRTFADLPPETVAQETEGFLLLSQRTLPARGVEPPMPKGDLGLRIHHHPLLSAIAGSGDILEAGLDLGSAGLDVRARLVPGPGSPTAELLGEARDGEGGLADFLPHGTFLRIETTLAPAFPAEGLARRLARHAGFPEERDRVIVERLLREALTGADPKSGLAIGVEAKGGEVSIVVAARDADGPASPILRKLREEERSAFGPLIFDRRSAPAGLAGWHVWIAQAEPDLSNLPECLWGAVDRLSDEGKGLPVAYAGFPGWSVVGIGPRADVLAHETRVRLQAGSSRTLGGSELLRLRGMGEGDYVMGVIVEAGTADLPAEDLVAWRAAFGGLEGARGPQAFAAACFRAKDGLLILARAYY